MSLAMAVFVDGDDQRFELGIFFSDPGKFKALENSELHLVVGQLFPQIVGIRGRSQVRVHPRLLIHECLKRDHGDLDERLGNVSE